MCCPRGGGGEMGVCQVGERIIKRFVQNAEMKEEEEKNNDKIRIALILFLALSVAYQGQKKKSSL